MGESDRSSAVHVYGSFQQSCLYPILVGWLQAGKEGNAPVPVENGKLVIPQDSAFHDFDVVAHSRNAANWVKFLCNNGDGNLPSETALDRISIIGEVLRNPRMMAFARNEGSLLEKWAMFHDAEKALAYMRPVSEGGHIDIDYPVNTLYQQFVEKGRKSLEELSLRLAPHSHEKLLSTIGTFCWMEEHEYVTPAEKEILIKWHLLYEDMTAYVKGRITEDLVLTGKYELDEIAAGAFLVFVDEIAKGKKKNAKLDEDWGRLRKLISIR